jgi:hypothetical protein
VQLNDLLSLSSSAFGDSSIVIQTADGASDTEPLVPLHAVQLHERALRPAQDAAAFSCGDKLIPSAVDRLFRMAAAESSMPVLTSNGSLTTELIPSAQAPTNGPGTQGSGWVTNAAIPVDDGLTQTTTVASADGNTIYVIGGGLGAGPDATVNTVLAFDVPSGTWSQRASLPTPLRAFGAAAETTDPFTGDESIYVFGGFDGARATSALNKYDTITDTWSTGTPVPNSPTGRFGAAVAVLNDGSGRILVAGGAGNLLQNDAYLYDPLSDSYTSIAPIPGATPYRIHAASSDDGRQFHVFGGGFEGRGHFVYDVTTAPGLPRPLFRTA